MDQKLNQLLAEQLTTLVTASQVLNESHVRVRAALCKKGELTVEERESCEALTARFARLCDFLFQRAFRTLDRIELQEEGTAIDRLNRMEKRGIIDSTENWRTLRELRNAIAHEYLIEKSDRVLKEAFDRSPELLKSVDSFKAYVKSKKY